MMMMRDVTVADDVYISIRCAVDLSHSVVYVFCTQSVSRSNESD